MALDQNFLKAKIPLLELSINCQNPQFLFWSTEKSQKIWSTENETFDQLKKDNFDQVKFGLTTPCRLILYIKTWQQFNIFRNNSIEVVTIFDSYCLNYLVFANHFYDCQRYSECIFEIELIKENSSASLIPLQSR